MSPSQLQPAPDVARPTRLLPRSVAIALARAGRIGITSAIVGCVGFAIAYGSFLVLAREESFPFGDRNNPNLNFVARLARAFLIGGFALLCFYGPRLVRQVNRSPSASDRVSRLLDSLRKLRLI